MNFTVFDFAEAFEDCPEILSFIGGKDAAYILEDCESRIFAITFAPHFFYDSYCLIKQAAA